MIAFVFGLFGLFGLIVGSFLNVVILRFGSEVPLRPTTSGIIPQ